LNAAGVVRRGGLYGKNVDISVKARRQCRFPTARAATLREWFASTRRSANTEDYDWAIVPFEEYMHGFASPDVAPMIGTPKPQ
jgi:hypothetical protein